jgi:hypothetical protein
MSTHTSLRLKLLESKAAETTGRLVAISTAQVFAQRVMAHLQKAADGPRWWLLPGLSFAALAAVSFTFFKDALFYRYDGTSILTVATAQKQWMAPGIGFSLNFLQGLGDIWIPTATPLMPGFALGSLVGNDRWMPVVACFVFALEFFFSTLFLARFLGVGRATSLAAALIGAMFTMPFFVPTLAAWRLWGNPHFMPAIAASTLALCAYVAIGRARWKVDAALLAAISLLLAYLIVSQPVRAAIAAVMLAYFGAAVLIGAADNRERLHKLAAAVLIVAVLGTAFGGYLFALFYYARTTYFWNDIATFPVNWAQQSFLSSESGPAGPYLWTACLAGAALVAWRERGRLRVFALAFLSFVALQQAVFLTAQFGGFTWGGPPPAYIDMFCMPLNALFGAYLLVGWWVEEPRNLRWALPALILLPWGSAAALHHPYSILSFHQQNPFLWPPHETSITRLLRAETGLQEGSPFRGRVANIAGTGLEPQYAWVPLVSQHNYDGAVSFYTGNDHRYYGLWYFGIPTLIEDNQFSSPFFHVVNSRLLSTPEQKHVRQLTTVTRFDPRILAMLGVRFVITDRPWPGLVPKTTLIVTPENPDFWTLYLYELPNVNTAGYWATRPLTVDTTRQAMLWMAAPASAADAVVYEPLTAPLVAGTSSELRVFRDRLEVEADSPGTSLLVLPVEFSHCFDIQPSDLGSARFLRANIDQAAFLFSGHLHAELRYRYAPWHSGCRLRDIDDASQLKLREVGWPQ